MNEADRKFLHDKAVAVINSCSEPEDADSLQLANVMYAAATRPLIHEEDRKFLRDNADALLARHPKNEEALRLAKAMYAASKKPSSVGKLFHWIFDKKKATDSPYPSSEGRLMDEYDSPPGLVSRACRWILDKLKEVAIGLARWIWSWIEAIAFGILHLIWTILKVIFYIAMWCGFSYLLGAVAYYFFDFPFGEAFVIGLVPTMLIVLVFCIFFLATSTSTSSVSDETLRREREEEERQLREEERQRRLREEDRQRRLNTGGYW